VIPHPTPPFGIGINRAASSNTKLAEIYRSSAPGCGKRTRTRILEVKPAGSSGLGGTVSAWSMPAAGKTAPMAIKTSVRQKAT